MGMMNNRIEYINELARDNPQGVFVLGFGSHVATVVNGDIYDTWDSTGEIPVYVWYRVDT